jgi:hypothetical protein
MSPREPPSAVRRLCVRKAAVDPLGRLRIKATRPRPKSLGPTADGRTDPPTSRDGKCTLQRDIETDRRPPKACQLEPRRRRHAAVSLRADYRFHVRTKNGSGSAATLGPRFSCPGAALRPCERSEAIQGCDNASDQESATPCRRAGRGTPRLLRSQGRQVTVWLRWSIGLVSRYLRLTRPLRREPRLRRS